MWQHAHKIKTHKCRLCLISKLECCGQMFETLRWLRFISCMAFCLDNHIVDYAISAVLLYCFGDDLRNFIVAFPLMAQTVSSVMAMQPNHTECEGPLLSLMSADLNQKTDDCYFLPVLNFLQLYAAQGVKPKVISAYFKCTMPSCFFAMFLRAA